MHLIRASNFVWGHSGWKEESKKMMFQLNGVSETKYQGEKWNRHKLRTKTELGPCPVGMGYH